MVKLTRTLSIHGRNYPPKSQEKKPIIGKNKVKVRAYTTGAHGLRAHLSHRSQNSHGNIYLWKKLCTKSQRKKLIGRNKVRMASVRISVTHARVHTGTCIYERSYVLNIQENNPS